MWSWYDALIAAVAAEETILLYRVDVKNKLQIFKDFQLSWEFMSVPGPSLNGSEAAESDGGFAPIGWGTEAPCFARWIGRVIVTFYQRSYIPIIVRPFKKCTVFQIVQIPCRRIPVIENGEFSPSTIQGAGDTEVTGMGMIWW